MPDVLLVDDDSSVRATLTRMLEHGGLQVVSASNGMQALAELLRHRVRAIVSDINMPFLEGRRFYAELVREQPAMAERVVFVTGWSDDKGVRAIAERSGRPVLQKPVKATELVSAVKAILAQDD